MNTPQALANTALTMRPFAVFVLLLFLALRVALDMRALFPMHALVGAGRAASSSYNLYLAALSLALFRLGAVSLALVLLWRRHWAGLMIAAILFFAELYSEALRDLTGGVVRSAFGPPATDPDAYARTLGRYTMLVAPLAALAWCSFASSSRKYFRQVL